MAHLAEDEAIAKTQPDFYAPKAYGDFLRAFTQPMLKGLNQQAAELGWTLRNFYRENLASRDSNKYFDTITFDFDSTLNRQYGLKMEGVRPGYKEYLCLDTLQVFYDRSMPPAVTISENGP